MTGKNNFDKRGGELMPRELMERAADPALVPDEALVAVLLKTGAHGLNVIELSRRLIEAFGSMKSLVSGDWRTLEERIKDWNKTHPDRDPKPSKADLKFTERLVALAKIAEIRFLDHLVLGDGVYVSLHALHPLAFTAST